MIWLYDASWEGLLTAVFSVFEARDADASILSREHFPGVTLFATQTVPTDEGKAGRVQRGLARLSPALPRAAYYAFLSEQPDSADALLATLRIGFQNNRNPLSQRQLDPVRRLLTLSQRVGGEAHRFLQFVRFVHAGDDLYVADIEPDFGILPLLGNHFHMRFGDQRLMIRDVKRRRALLSTPEAWTLAELPPGPLPPLPRDTVIEDMWRAYFKSISNKARENRKLQQQFVPLKYRKFLTEFQFPAGAPPSGS